MARIALLLALSMNLAALACSKESTPPIEPNDEPLILDLGDSSITDGAILLTLHVIRVSWTAAPWGPHDCLNLEVTARSTGPGVIRYDPGSCGCPSPSAWIQHEDDSVCYRIRPLCPCSTGDIRELEPGEEARRIDLWPLCGEGPLEAATLFGYSMEQDGEWVQRFLEIRLPLESAP